MRDLRDFKHGYYFKEGIFNVYLRVLDVYNELRSAKLNLIGEKPKTIIKIFETTLLEEFATIRNTDEISHNLELELQDFFAYDILIVALMNYDRFINQNAAFNSNYESNYETEGKCAMFVIEMNPDQILVKLYWQSGINEDEGNQNNS